MLLFMPQQTFFLKVWPILWNNGPKSVDFCMKCVWENICHFFPMVLLCYFMLYSDRVFYAESDGILIFPLTLIVQKLWAFFWKWSGFVRKLCGFIRKLRGFTRKWGAFTIKWSGFTRRWSGFTRKWTGFTRKWCGFARNWCEFTIKWFGFIRKWCGFIRKFSRTNFHSYLTPIIR